MNSKFAISPRKLTRKQYDLLKLFERSKSVDGWAQVSSVVFPHILDMPKELMIIEKTENGGRARITDASRVLLEWI